MVCYRRENSTIQNLLLTYFSCSVLLEIPRWFAGNVEQGDLGFYFKVPENVDIQGFVAIF